MKKLRKGLIILQDLYNKYIFNLGGIGFNKRNIVWKFNRGRRRRKRVKYGGINLIKTRKIILKRSYIFYLGIFVKYSS
jgi:hypothetical protein